MLALASVFFMTFLCYMQTPLLEGFENKTYDLRFKVMRGAIPARSDIAIIAIDEKSIAELGRFPFSRTHYSSLIDNVSAAGAKALLIDAFFPEIEEQEIDQAFADSMRIAGNVYLAKAFQLNRYGQAIGVTSSIETLAEAAKGIGHINFLPDEDGVNRHSLLLIEFEGKTHPSLPLLGAMAALDVTEVTQSTFEIEIGDKYIPTAANGTMMINHVGPPGSYQTFSFVDVAKGRISPERLKGKVLFLGATALGIYDMRVTPFSGNVPGVEINANIADNILSGIFIRRSGIESLIDIFFILAVGLASFLIVAKLRLFPSLFLLIFIAAGFISFNYYMFLQGHWLSLIYPLAGMMLAFAVSAAFRFVTLDRRAREVRTLFSSYVSDKVVDHLVSDLGESGIEVSTKEVTVLFSDLNGFTAYSETVDPYMLVSTLNEYLAAMTRIIMEYGGTVDKFLGDGIMAYWGAPLDQQDHAEMAIECTLAMQQSMLSLQNKWHADGIEPLEFRVGINSGDVIAGTIGAKGKKMEYTVIGDPVNLGARLESSAKYYGVAFLVSESTYKATSRKFIYRKLDRIRVVGKKVPITIYELIAFPADHNSQDTLSRVAQYEEALALYHAKDWDNALIAFAAYHKAYPKDRAGELFISRCVSFKTDPPEDGWDGVYERRGK